jgi:sugar lactone lactonase YvrE
LITSKYLAVSANGRTACLSCLSWLRWPVLIAAVFVWLCGLAPLISDADAGVTLSYYLETGKNPSSHPVTAASPVATPIPKLSPAIYATLPSLDTVAVYPLASNGNVPSLAGNTAISNPGGIGYWADRLYVTNVAANSITVYPAGANGSPSPIVTIQGEHTLLDSPTAIAFDSHGNIYVANAGKGGGGQDSITKYAAGSSGDAAPVAHINGANTKLFSPSGLTVDSSGNIYVANPGSTTYAANQKPVVEALDSITVYSPGSTGNIAPVRTISGNLTRLSSPSGIAVDSSGNLYVDSLGVQGSQGAGILIFAPGSNGNVAPTLSIDGDCANLTTTGPIALDANANIFVGGYDKIVAYAHDGPFPPKGAVECLVPAFQISGPQTGIKEITGISVDSVGDIFVTDSETNSVSAFQSGDKGDVEPLATIATPTNIFEPTGVALDSSGTIYVANGNRDRAVSNRVTIYAPGSNAATAPIGSIEGDKAGISGPFAVAVDKAGNLYVANQVDGYDFDGSIRVYSAGSVGDVAPIAKIAGTSTGDKTGLHSPIGLAVNAANKLYVLNEFGDSGRGGSITIYPAGANGNVAPEARIADGASKRTQLNSPAGLALDSAGNIYVTNDGGSNSITVYAAGSKGDVAPKAVISGSDTGLNTPRGIAIDSNGNIYVANARDGVATDESEDDSDSSQKAPATITVYPMGSNGNVKPLATITGPLTSLEHPEGIAIGPTNLTPPQSQALAFYDWSVTASPNLAANAPSREAVERFMVSIETSTDGLLLIDGTEKLRSYKFADLRHNGFLSLVAQTSHYGTASCSDFSNAGFCSVYIVDKTRTGFEIYRTLGSIEPGGTAPLGVQDLGHDGNLEVIVNQPFTPVFSQCFVSWPAIYASSGDGYRNVSDRFKDFYRGQLDALNKLNPNLPPTAVFHDQRDKECLDAEVAKIERVLGSPNAGMDTAIAFTQSKDQKKYIFGIYVLMDINTPQAHQSLDTLSNSPNPDIKRVMTQLASLHSKGLDKSFNQFERLR